MTLMLAKTYSAFKAAGVDDDQAQAAAEELAAFEARFTSIGNEISHIDGKMTSIDGKITVLMWAVGINAAATIAILGVLLRHG
ncbi:MAG: hypothetical protein JO001_15285 [Alphaproteobacteria bacterium]|nr:hypothetical protein [Alphaproteobacteria bacterium]